MKLRVSIDMHTLLRVGRRRESLRVRFTAMICTVTYYHFMMPFLHVHARISFWMLDFFCGDRYPSGCVSAAKLLGVSPKALATALTERTFSAGECMWVYGMVDWFYW